MQFLESLPRKSDYFTLFNTTGWNEEYHLSEDDLFASLPASWHAVSAYEGSSLIGFGRTISDGVLHALIVDMIVHPLYQGKGIGGAIIDRLVARCKEKNIRDIQLFCAKGKSGFYVKQGFVRRPDDAPGMEFQKPTPRLRNE